MYWHPRMRHEHKTFPGVDVAVAIAAMAMMRRRHPAFEVGIYAVALGVSLVVMAVSRQASSQTPPPNQAPTFDDSSVERSVAENSPAGSSVGDPITASDQDDTTLAYTLEGADAALFTVAASGQIMVGEDTQLDYETRTGYTVTLRATDPESASATVDVSITVTDVNDPNIIMIMADDAGYEVFGPYGTTQYSTPRIDEIAAAGTVFTHAYAHPLCLPTRVALMTGKQGDRNYEGWHLPEDSYTFADYFRSAGYATAVTGKWQLHLRTIIHQGTPAGDGFDNYCLWYTDSSKGSRYWDPKIECDGTFIDTTAEDYGPDIFVDFIDDFIDENRERPFFVYYPMVLPHGPYELPPGASCSDSDDVQCIFEHMVTRIDHNVGRIYDKLKSAGLLDNTVLFFTGDNGSDPRVVSELDGETIYGDKGVTTDGGTRVPLVVWVPGQEGGREYDDLIDFTDFLATFVSAVGVELPEDEVFDGVSFWERLQGNPGAPREWLYMYYFSNPYGVTGHGIWFSPQSRFVRDKRYKLYDSGDLYDVAADPLEVRLLPWDDTESATARSTLQAVLSSTKLQPAQGITWPLVRPRDPRRVRNRPELVRAKVDRSELTLIYVGLLEADSVPPADSFAVTVDGAARSVTAVSVNTDNTNTVSLTLDSRVYEDESVVVSYTPGTNPVRRRGDVAAFPGVPLVDEPVQNVTPTNRPPVVSGPAAVTYTENATVEVGAYTAVDVDGDDVIWSRSGADAGLFTVVDGVVRFLSPPDYDAYADADGDNRYNVEVRASDGRLTISYPVTVTVTNVNEPPLVSGPSMVSVDENHGGQVARFSTADPESGTVTQSLQGPDRNRLALSGGTLRFVASPDFESPEDSGRDNRYEVTVVGSDGKLVTSHPVTVTVANVDEEGMVELSTVQPQVGTDLETDLSDPDGSVTGLSWMWERSATGTGNWSTITGASGDSYTPTDADLTRYLRVTASYTDGEGSGKTVRAVSDNPVQMAPVSNAPPQFPSSETGMRRVEENTPAGRDIGDPVAAMDPDVGDQPTYKLEGTDSASFEVDRLSGQLRTRDALDFEEKPSYVFTVSVTDASGEEDMLAARVVVVNIDEPPDLSGPTAVGYPENSILPVGIYIAADPERAAITWTLDGPDQDRLRISSQGVLAFVAPPDYENTVDFNADRVFEVTVEASDATNTSARNVLITVGNVDEDGAVTLASASATDRPQVGSLLNATLFDPDGGVQDLEWRWERSSNRRDWIPIFTSNTAAHIPTSADVGHYLKAVVIYNDSEGPAKTAAADTTSTVIDPTQQRGGGSEGAVSGAGGAGVGGGGGDEGLPPRASELFEDIDPGVWYEQAVSWMILHNITSGCNAAMFCPEANLTRQQFVTFLWRAAGRPSGPYQGSEAFADVIPGGYAEQSIGWAVANGVTKGCTPGQYGDSTWQFCPTRPVTRGQMATLLYRHAAADYIGASPPYTDVDPDRFYTPGITWLTDFRVAPGCGPDLFCPNRNATRAEAAVFIYGVAIRPHLWGEGNTNFIPQPQ